MAYCLDSEKVWKLAEVDKKISASISTELGLTPLTSVFLANRGIKSSSEANAFLNPSSENLSEPSLLPDIKKAAQRIKQAIKAKELIYIHGDYDVDGITSTTLLFEVLEKLGAKVRYHIPCRFKEGYGLNKKSLNKIIKEGATLLVTVDCGIKSFSEIEYAQKNGLDVIITDHHEPAKTWPKALAVVNPKLPHAEIEDRNLAGVGVALKLAQLLADDSLEELYDLVALGTVADIAPLLNENRYFTQRGIDILNNYGRLGVNFLSKEAGIDGKSITSSMIGYTLAPRLNASGRISNANVCVELLTTKDTTRAQSIAQTLEEVNRKRQKVEEQMLKDVMNRVEQKIDLDKDKVIFLADASWHDGVKGIIASRIKDRFFRPTFIGTVKDGSIKASARSIPNFSVHKALESCADLLDNFGGHEKAGALSVGAAKVDELNEKLNTLADEWLDEEDLKPVVTADCQATLADFQFNLQDELKKMAPFGEGNREPLVLLEDVYLQNQQRLGKKGNHLRLNLFKDNKQMPAVAFGLEGFSAVLNHQGRSDIVASLDLNEFNSRITLQLRIADLKLHSLDLENPNSVVEHLFANKERLAAKEEYQNIGDVDSFHTKIVGVTFEGRQEVINKLKPNTSLVIKREPDNKHDPNAIRILTEDNTDLGFLNKRLAKKLAPLIDSGGEFECRVTDLTGGGEKNYGVNVAIKRNDFSNEIELESSRKRKFNDAEEALEQIKAALLAQNKFHYHQKEALNNLLAQKNTLTIMGTGRGKSAIFHTVGALKSLLENKTSIFLYPLRSLITDQYLFLKDSLVPLGLNVIRLSGDCSVNERQKIFRALKEGAVDIILTTPEFLHHNIDSFVEAKERVGFVVVDEAHHLDTASQSHRPLYKGVGKLLSILGKPLVMAATATANKAVCQKIIDVLRIEETVIDFTVRDNLYLVDKRKISNKESYLANLISKGDKVLIYVNSREKAASLADNLRHLAKDYRNKIVYYHAGLSAKLRTAIQEGFTDSTYSVVVATSAFGEGINIADIRDLVLYHLPFSFIEYNQQSGRSGRDGQEARIHLVYGEEDARINELILEGKSPSRKTLASVWQSLNIMATKDGKLKGAPEDIIAQLNEEQPYAGFSKQTIASSLKIFADLGIIEVRSGECEVGSGRLEGGTKNNAGKSVVILQKGKKVDLSDSVIYEEGLHEKEQFNEFKQWALEADVDPLLKMVNQPIYPQEAIERKQGTVLIQDY